MEVVRVAVTVLKELNKFVEKTDIGHEVDFPKFHQLIKGVLQLIDLFPEFKSKTCQDDLDFLRNKVENPSCRISPVVPEEEEGKGFKYEIIIFVE